LALVAKVLAGDETAAARFSDLAVGPIWTAVCAVEGAGAAGEAAFNQVVDALRADGCRRLRAYDGRSTLSTFLALQCREVLLAQVSRAFAETPDLAWRRFERFFGPEMRSRVRRRFPRADAAMTEDLYQDLCLCLVENGYQRIRSYNGQGSFGGFIGVTVERVLIDLIRREAPRRRVPADVERMPILEQRVFFAIAWRGVPAETSRLMEALDGHEPAAKDAEAVAMAIERVTPAVHKTRSGRGLTEAISIEAAAERGAPLVLVDDGASPEQALEEAEDERSRASLVAAIKSMAERRPPEERLYLQLVFSATDPLPPREIAKLMGRPIDEVRQIQQRVQRWAGDLARRKMESVA
jgi:RNA polymerase primary sigma factor